MLRGRFDPGCHARMMLGARPENYDNFEESIYIRYHMYIVAFVGRHVPSGVIRKKEGAE